MNLNLSNQNFTVAVFQVGNSIHATITPLEPFRVNLKNELSNPALKEVEDDLEKFFFKLFGKSPMVKHLRLIPGLFDNTKKVVIAIYHGEA